MTLKASGNTRTKAAVSALVQIDPGSQENVVST